jgi:hypothetical protein
MTELHCEGATGKQWVDYVLLSSPFSDRRPQVSEVLATCEFKGPARPTLWQFKPNWYNKNKERGLLPDVRKQLSRASSYPHVEHYCAWVAMLSNRRSKVKRDFMSSLDTLSRQVRIDLDLPEGGIATFCAHRFDEIDSNMCMFLLRVTAR